MQTQLPKKLTFGNPYSSGSGTSDIKEAVNQLIDVVAELTEVVEGKQDKENVTYGLGANATGGTPIGLKEKLMGEIAELIDYGKAGQSFTIKRSDVEAIINRLIP